jgi:hypothetical protein
MTLDSTIESGLGLGSALTHPSYEHTRTPSGLVKEDVSDSDTVSKVQL